MTITKKSPHNLTLPLSNHVRARHIVSLGIPASMEKEDELPPYSERNPVNRALNRLWRVQAGCKLPACLQPIRPAQALPAATAAPASNGRTSPTAVAGTVAAPVAAAVAPASCPLNYSLDQFVAGAGTGPCGASTVASAGNSLNSPHSRSCGNLSDLAAAEPMSARPRVLQQQQSTHVHVHWTSQPQQQDMQFPSKQQCQFVLPGRQRERSFSVRSSASAIACAGQAATAGKSAVGSAGGLLSAQSSSMILTPGLLTPSPLYEPTFEDLKPYLRSNGGEEGVEAFIHRRLQQAAAERAVPAGARAGKLPPSHRYYHVVHGDRSRGAQQVQAVAAAVEAVSAGSIQLQSYL